MKRLFITLLTLASSLQFVMAQPTKAEMDKMMKQAQEMMKKYGNDSTVKKAMKDAQDKQKQVSDAMKNNQNGTIAASSVNKTDSAVFSLPSRNSKLLNSLPIRTFNRAELVSYLHNLNSKLTEYLRTSYGTDITDISIKALEQSGSPIGLWMKGSVNESVLVALKGAELHPDNNLLLNNTGGILTSCGLGFYGIPVLEYVLEKQPDNNMILNNLGQAYFDLGDDKKAEQYLLKCINSYKFYPDANLALAYIYNSRGQKSTAISYAENSLRGAWSSKADNFLSKLKPDLKMMDYVRHRYKQPEYFDIRKYPMIEQCTSIATIATLEPQYVAFRSMIDKVAEKYTRLLNPAVLSAANSVPEKLMTVNQTKRNPFRPFGTFGNVVLQAMKDEYSEKFRHLDSFRLNYYKEREKLNQSYETEYQKIESKYAKMVYGDDPARCKEINALSNAYLPQYAEQTELLQKKMLAYYKDYLNDIAYWSYIASVNDDQFHVSFYTLVLEFLARLKEINTTRFMESKYGNHRFYPCEYEASGSIKADTLEIELPDCYLTPKIEADLGAFKLEISCEAYKLEAGEGLVGKIEYARSSGDVTLAFGVGASVPRVLFKAPGLEGGIEAEAKSQLYITFDKMGTPTDLGVLWEAELKAVIEGGGIKGSAGLEEGLTAGFGSGVQMKENSQLKQAIDKTYPVQPDDKQINKKVPLYKPKQ
jgi:tetratricopeptide (TPR) repeat protein